MKTLLATANFAIASDKFPTLYTDTNITFRTMNIEPLDLESEFKVSQFKLHLQQHPESSHRLAMKNYEHWLALAQAYKKLCKKHESLQSEYSEFIAILNQISDARIHI